MLSCGHFGSDIRLETWNLGLVMLGSSNIQLSTNHILIIMWNLGLGTQGIVALTTGASEIDAIVIAIDHIYYLN